MRNRIISLCLSLVLILSMVGCGNKEVVKEENNKPSENISSTNEVDIERTSFVIDNLTEKYGTLAGNSNYDYNSIMTVEQEHSFIFECSDKIVNSVYADKVFAVYNGLEDVEYLHNYAKCEYKDGKIVVSPGSTLKFVDKGELTEDNKLSYTGFTEDGTWGSENKLYLFQYYDLETGNKLDTPIVTPFIVKHLFNSTTVTQSVDEGNNYVLTWNKVENASKYVVIKKYGNVGNTYIRDGYIVEYITSDTSANSKDFFSQQHTNSYENLVEQDLKNWGFDTTESVKGTTFMNAALADNYYSHVYDYIEYAVVCISNEGKSSGFSNFVDSTEMFDYLPYTLKDVKLSLNISSDLELPAYVTAYTVNGKEIQLPLQYKGATIKGDSGISPYYLYPIVANSSFSPIMIEVTGLSFDDFKANHSDLLERQVNIITKASENKEMFNTPTNIVNTPENDNEPVINQEIENSYDLEPTVETEPTVAEPNSNTTESESTVAEPDSTTAETEPTTTEPESTITESDSTTAETEPTTTEPKSTITEPESTITESDSTTEPNPTTQPEFSTDLPTEPLTKSEQLFYEVANGIQPILSDRIFEDLETVLFANNAMEEWIALCLIAQSEYIPVPTSIFPEATDLDYVTSILVEAYRQNPISGVLNDIGYSYEYECLVVQYAETPEIRFERVEQELSVAKKIANQLITSDMSDYDKILVINNYLCNECEYDESSADCDVDLTAVSQRYIDSHTPYGILVTKTGVCESYSEAFILIGRFAGLNVISDIGTLFGGPHEWNRVQVNGKWCVIDVTNNDDTDIPNALFNISESQMNGILVSNCSTYTFDVTAETNEYEYYKQMGLSANNSSDLIKLVNSELEKGKALILVRCDNFDDATQTSLVQSLLENPAINENSSLGYCLNIVFVQP